VVLPPPRIKRKVKKMNTKLTNLEKKVLVEAMEEGFLYDADLRTEECPFLTWGFAGCGRAERGAVSSLIKKGVIVVDGSGSDETAYLQVNYTTLCGLLGIENPAYNYDDTKSVAL
jgi:hypothetical protein